MNPPAGSTTPMLKQYQEIKKKHQDCILFFRLGDFYEMFYGDAKIASRALDLVLTSRGKGTANKVPMCGVPYHSAKNYIARLIKAGHKVAICEQTEDPSQAKGIVRREVIRVITSGTYLDEDSSDARFLVSITPNGQTVGVAFTDPAKGTIQANEFTSSETHLIELMSRIPVAECIFPESSEEKIRRLLEHPLLKLKNITLSPYQDYSFNPDMAKKSLCKHFSTANLNGFGIEEKPYATSSAGALLEYLKEMNKKPLQHIDKVSLYTDDDFVFISPAAMRGLEMDGFIKALDKTETAMGRRQFRDWMTHPLRAVPVICERQRAVEALKDQPDIADKIKDVLKNVPDLEKNISRLSCGYTHARDFLNIRNTLCLIPEIEKLLSPLSGGHPLLKIDDMPDLREFLVSAVNEDIPLSKPEGKVIAGGYSKELDELRGIQENGNAWLKDYQAKEIKQSGINSLKVGFNKVFGYYIEVTKTHIDKVPENYIRKQTLVNAERFITEELKEFEEKILTAQEKIIALENSLIQEVQQNILDESIALHALCQGLATVDTLCSLAALAASPGYCLPEISGSTTLDIKSGRHPVIEQILDKDFIPNDCQLDCGQNHLTILTGPNMAGKSTYIRQVALLVILAQTGSFIPAESAHIGTVDKIFTRIGAHDDLQKGQSTFMVEMNETADILNNMTERSLVILDEIGRGTSTFDGLSLAWALGEHLKEARTRTLFATHFHELTALADEHAGVKNYNVAVKEWKDEIVFLHKIVPGSTDDSYGIYVAKLAGIPETVLRRAKHILSELEMKGNLRDNLRGKTLTEEQLNLFQKQADPLADEIKDAIESLDVNNLTPVEAINKLQELKDKLKEKS